MPQSTTFCYISQLQHLVLTGNEFTGEIPKELGRIRGLLSLNLAKNQLTGEIPIELGDIVNLRSLDLSENQLSGQIPSSLSRPRFLSVLNLGSNRLSGNIPPELGDTEFLNILKVDNNLLMAGALPANLTSLTGMSQFWFDGTGLCETSDEAFQGWIQNIFDVRSTGCIVSSDEHIETPLSNKLEANYPNPFNPETTISYSLARPGRVELTVFDVTGKLVKTLENRVLAAGEHTVSFNASGLSTGVYFYTLSVGNFRETKKMVLLK